jgi:hypothetical protein
MNLSLPQRSARILVAWPFLLALIVLLLNDVVLKYSYPGWITGKLSDVAGLFLVGGLALLVSLRHRGPWLLLAAVSFIWWKSAQSQWLFDFLQANGVSVGRVVDPTDLIALVALPLGAMILRPHVDRPRVRARPIAAALSGSVLLLALMGTSALPMVKDFSIRTADPVGQIDVAEASRILDDIAKEFELRRCEDCDANHGVVFTGRKGLYLRYVPLPQSRGMRVVLDGSPGSPIFGWGSTEERLEYLQSRIQYKMAAAFPNMELVIDLERRGPSR